MFAGRELAFDDEVRNIEEIEEMLVQHALRLHLFHEVMQHLDIPIELSILSLKGPPQIIQLNNGSLRDRSF